MNDFLGYIEYQKYAEIHKIKKKKLIKKLFEVKSATLNGSNVN